MEERLRREYNTRLESGLETKDTEIQALREEMEEMIEAHIQETLETKDKQIKKLQDYIEKELAKQELEKNKVLKEFQRLENLFETLKQSSTV